jgi:hypothetical protein
LLSGLSATSALSAARPRTDPIPAEIRSLPAPEGVPSPSDSSAPSLLADPQETDPRDGDPRPVDLTVAGGGSARPPYSVVDEIGTPHGTSASAQGLPSLPFFGVIGTFGSGDTLDVYRLPVGRGVSEIEFDLFASSVAASGSVRFVVFTGSGQVLGHWSSGDFPGTQYVGADLGGTSRDSALFLGIEMAGSTNSAASIDYQLWVTMLGVLVQPTASEGVSQPAPPLVAGPFVASMNFSASELAAAPSRGDPAPSSARLPSSSGSEIRLATGPLPARSAAPLGGATAADRDPAPDARSSGLSATFDHDDRVIRTADLAPVKEPRIRPDSSRDEGARALVALRGPGGSPLLGAAAIGRWRSNTSAATVPAPDELASGLETVSPSEAPSLDLAGVLPHVCVLSPNPAISPARTDSEVHNGTPVSPTLGLAIAVTLNALFSDPCAGFDVLASHLDPKPGRASRGRARSARDGRR